MKVVVIVGQRESGDMATKDCYLCLRFLENPGIAKEILVLRKRRKLLLCCTLIKLKLRIVLNLDLKYALLLV